MSDQPCPCCGHDQMAVEMVIKDEFEENEDLKAKVAALEARCAGLERERESARTSIDKICKEYRQRTNELDSLRVYHNQALVKRGELEAKLAAAEAQLAELDGLLLGALAAMGVPTPVEGYRAIGWSFLRGHMKQAVARAEAAEEALRKAEQDRAYQKKRSARLLGRLRVVLEERHIAIQNMATVCGYVGPVRIDNEAPIVWASKFMVSEVRRLWEDLKEAALERDAAIAVAAPAKEALLQISKAIALNPFLNQAHAEAVLQAVKDKADTILAGHAPATEKGEGDG